MNLDHLKLMETLTRTGSLRQAAEELNTSQPRLTQQLQQMERALGVVLFRRSPRGLEISEAGRTFLPFAHRISATFNSAQSAISKVGGRSRTLRLGISITASLHLVPANLLAFHKLHPEVAVSVTRATPRQLLKGLEDDRFDLCIGLELPESSLFMRDEIFGTRMVGFSAASKETKKRRSLGEFCRWPLILPPRSCGTRKLLDVALKRASIQPQILMEVDDVNTILALVKTGIAATILPQALPTVSRSLIVSQLEDFVGEVKGTLLYPRKPTPESRSFIRIASERTKLQVDGKSA